MIDDDDAWVVVHELVVEVVSQHNPATDIERRIHEYFAAGVQTVWVLYSLARRHYVLLGQVLPSVDRARPR